MTSVRHYWGGYGTTSYYCRQLLYVYSSQVMDYASDDGLFLPGRGYRVQRHLPHHVGLPARTGRAGVALRTLLGRIQYLQPLHRPLVRVCLRHDPED